MTRANDPARPRLLLHSSADPSALQSFTSAPAVGKSHLAAGDVDELRTAIERSLCEGELHDASELVVDAELRKSIRVACAKARLQRVRAEHVLIDVKGIWSAIPPALTTRTGVRLEQIVSACIDEYYTEEHLAHS